jgi:hypothetical protein
LIAIDELAALLHAAACDATPVTYAEVLNAFGFAFTRPKMRALCVLLGDVDALERGADRPELAVLVVRASDGLPGQGWWVAELARGSDYAGLWNGPDAAAYIRARHAEVFDFWAKRQNPVAGPR